MNIALTGASGHIGNCLWRTLVSKGLTVKALVHESHVGNHHEGLQTVQGDLMDRDSLIRLCEGAEVMFHLAARIGVRHRDNPLVYKVNVEGTRNVIDACKKAGVRRLVHFSSIHALQAFPLEGTLDETRALVTGTGTAYELSKAEGQRMALEAEGDALDVLVLNPTAVIGPYDVHHSLLGQAIIRICNNSLPMLVPGGYDWVDVRDVVQGAVSAIDRGRSGESYLLSGRWVSLLELSKAIGEIMGRKTPGRVVPGYVARIGLPFIQLSSRISGRHPLYTRESLTILRASHPGISSEKARAELGYTTRPLDETLLETINWYRQNGIIR